jgi:aspartate/methionine/tyrosine aminotransferase
MGVIADTFAAMLEEWQQRDDELNRDIQETIERCNILLDKLTKLDNE